MRVFSLLVMGLALGLARLMAADGNQVSVTVSSGGCAVDPAFLGLSYESSILLPDKQGSHYFSSTNTPLVSLFKTLGIRSLRVGANAVDDPTLAVPDEKDIDSLFGFARAANVKVIYSFRLKNGDPARSAQLAAYIQQHYADVLDCFAIGNEPEFFETIKKQYPVFSTMWRPHYEAILKAVPSARIEGPSCVTANFAIEFAKEYGKQPGVVMTTIHYYDQGSGRAAEKDPAKAREKFLSEKNSARYEQHFSKAAGLIEPMGVPVRIDEMNSCYNGGGKGCSDTYASTLWSLEWDHWWAAHRVLGLNYHTGEGVSMNHVYHAPNYGSFLHAPDGPGYDVRPIGYAHLAYSLAALDHALPVQTESPEGTNLAAFAEGRGSNTYTVTLINKLHGPQAQATSVKVSLPDSPAGSWQRIDLTQQEADIAATGGVMLGGASVGRDGTWSGKWMSLADTKGQIQVSVPPASVAILKFTAAR